MHSTSIKETLATFITVAAITLMIGAVAFLSFPAKHAQANPSYFCQDYLIASSTNPSTATTSTTYLNNGSGSATLTLTNCVSDIGLALNAATLFLQYQASSTPTAASSTLTYRVEVSHDGIDWYPMNNSVNSFATTTSINGTYVNNELKIATSTTIGGTGTTDRTHFAIDLPVNTLRTRVIFSVPQGSAPVALWAQVIGKREQLSR